MRSKGSNPKPGPQSRVPKLEREVLETLGCKNQQGFWLRDTKAAGDPGVPLKGPAHKLS